MGRHTANGEVPAVDDEVPPERGERGHEKEHPHAHAHGHHHHYTHLHVMLTIMLFLTTSLVAVFLNKILMSSVFFDFEAYFFLTFAQFCISLVCLFGLGVLSSHFPALSFVPRYQIRRDVARAVAPVTLCFCLSISFTNVCLGLVDVPLFSIVRNLVMIFTVIFTYIILGETTGPRVVGAGGLVLLGFIIGTAETARFSWSGVGMGLASCVWSALYAVLVKRVMPAVEGSTWKLLMYTTTLAIPMLAVAVVASGETRYLSGYSHASSGGFWAVLLLSGATGFAINISFFLMVKVTSPLTINIAGAVKSMCQSVLSAYLFGNAVTGKQIAGLVCCLAGSYAYSAARQAEAREKERLEALALGT